MQKNNTYCISYDKYGKNMPNVDNLPILNETRKFSDVDLMNNNSNGTTLTDNNLNDSFIILHETDEKEYSFESSTKDPEIELRTSNSDNSNRNKNKNSLLKLSGLPTKNHSNENIISDILFFQKLISINMNIV